MSDIQPRHYIIGLVMFAFFISGGVFMVYNAWQIDPNFISDDRFTQFNETFNKQQELQTNVDTLENRVKNLDLPEPLEFIANLFTRGYSVLVSISTSFSFMDGVFEGLEEFFGIPSFIVGTIITLITVIITFSIVSAILQRDI